MRGCSWYAIWPVVVLVGVLGCTSEDMMDPPIDPAADGIQRGSTTTNETSPAGPSGSSAGDDGTANGAGSPMDGSGSNGSAGNPSGGSGNNGNGNSGNGNSGNGNNGSASGQSFVLVDTGTITHNRDFFQYTSSMINQDAPKDWVNPIPYRDGRWRAELDVKSIGDNTGFPFFYTIIIKRCVVKQGEQVCGSKAGVLRMSIRVDALGENVGEGAVINFEKPFWDQYDHPPWDWTNAWRNLNGDVITTDGGKAFPVTLSMRLTISAP